MECPACSERADHMRGQVYHCPVCGEKLQATTYLLRWKWTTIPRPATRREAMEMINQKE